MKRAAAVAALDEVPPDVVVGVGTGSTTEHFIDALGSIRDRIRGAVASSLATAEHLRRAGIPVLELNDVGRLPIYVDGADEATRDRRLIKGGGGALTREKILAEASDRFVCILDESKVVDTLGRFPLPVECIPMARELVSAKLQRCGGRPELRSGFTTDNGNVILDVHGLTIDEPDRLEIELNQIPGVVTVGLFCRRPADLLVVGGTGGTDWL